MELVNCISGEKEQFQFGICITTCVCQFRKEKHKCLSYNVNRGSLVKIFEYSCNQVVLAPLIHKPKLVTSNNPHFDLIDLKLFKYLNTINNDEGRLEFYKDDKLRNFVLDLEKDTIVGVICDQVQIKAVFNKINEKDWRIFVEVDLSEKLSEDESKFLKTKCYRYSQKTLKLSLPANMIRKFDGEEGKTEENCIDEQTLSCLLCQTNNINDTKSSCNCKILKDNCNGGTFPNADLKVSGNGLNPEECLKISDKKTSTDEAFSLELGKLSSDDVDNQKHVIPDEESEIVHAVNIAVINKRAQCEEEQEKQVTPRKCEKCVQLNDYGSNNCDNCGYEFTVIRNSSVCSNCTICTNPEVTSQGFVLCSIQHTVCGTCIKDQIASEELTCLAVINNMPCGKSFDLIDLNETNSYIQRCFNKNCNGYHLWDEHYKSRPNKFNCNKCELVNCLQCAVIHDGLTCEEYGKLTNGGKSLDLELVLSYIRRLKAMPCSKCESSTSFDTFDHCLEIEQGPLALPPPPPPPPPPPLPPPLPPPSLPPPSRPPSSSSINPITNKPVIRTSSFNNQSDDFMDELRKKLSNRKNENDGVLNENQEASSTSASVPPSALKLNSSQSITQPIDDVSKCKEMSDAK